MYDSNYLKEYLMKIDLNPTDRQMSQLVQYFHLLDKWNKVMNLTAITEFNNVVQRHFIDSLAIFKYINLNKIHSFIDIGTGAGFPGIPIKIMFPELDAILLDSLNKRILFLDQVCETLELDKIICVHGRAEEMARKDNYRETFDLCVSRAVADLRVLSEYCIPFVKQDGFFISYKSGDVEEELSESMNTIKVLGGELFSEEKFVLPESDISRSFIIVKKKYKTLAKYPRKAGTIKKNPLK